jgi:hypothetical protein
MITTKQVPETLNINYDLQIFSASWVIYVPGDGHHW